MLLRAFAFALVLVAAVSANAQVVHHDPDLHWSITLPPGWEVAPPSLLDTANQVASERAAELKIRFVAGFKKRDDAPYAVVQFMNEPLEGRTAADIQQLIGADAAAIEQVAKEKLSDLLTDVHSNKPVIDLARNRYVLNLRMSAPGGGGELSAVCVGFFARHGIVQVNCYAPTPGFDAAMPDFDALIESVRIDADHVFTPAPANSAPPRRNRRIVLLPIVLGVGVVALVVLMARRKQARDREL